MNLDPKPKPLQAPPPPHKTPRGGFYFPMGICTTTVGKKEEEIKKGESSAKTKN
jgi:hypothetical protein